MDGIELILTAIVVSLYILFGSFCAWVIGVDPITLPWFSVVILWPVIGLVAFFIGVFFVGAVTAICAAIFGRGFLNFKGR